MSLPLPIIPWTQAHLDEWVAETTPADDGWYAAHRRRVEAEYTAAQEAKRAAQVAEINRVLGRIDEMGIEH